MDTKQRHVPFPGCIRTQPKLARALSTSFSPNKIPSSKRVLRHAVVELLTSVHLGANGTVGDLVEHLMALGGLAKHTDMQEVTGKPIRSVFDETATKLVV